MLYNNVIKCAMNEAQKSKYNLQIGAVIFKGKKIYGYGHNSIRSSSISMKYRKWEESLHAEQAALLKLDWTKLKGYSILVYRVNRNGKLGMARPCEMCQKLLSYVGIKNVYYTTNTGEIKFEKMKIE